MLIYFIAAALAVQVSFAGGEKAVACAELAFSDAAEQRNLADFGALIKTDAVFVGSGEPLFGRDAIVQAWGAAFFGPDSPRIAWRPRFVEIRADGQFALSTGPYRITAADGSIRWGKYSSNWELQPDGSWKVLFDNGFPGHGEMPHGDLDLFAVDLGC